MQNIKIQITRIKNLYASLEDDFCTPCAAWELDLTQFNGYFDVNFRAFIFRCLVKPLDINFEYNTEIYDLLKLTASKLQSYQSDEVFEWLLQVGKKHEHMGFVYPYLDEKIAGKAGPLAVNFLLKANLIWKNQNSLDTATNEIIKLFESIRQKVLQAGISLSTMKLLLKAKNRGIPTKRHSDRPSYQLGYGVQRKILYLGYTNHTSQIATTIATHKYLATSLLQEYGLPAPKHIVVRTLEEAKIAAKKIGFPLVVKPTSTDKGLGVTVGIQNENELKSGCSNATKYGPILVEEMLAGFDHRLHVINGECIYVVRRIPPFIVGDGITTVENLIHDYAEKRTLDPEYKRFPNANCNDPVVVEHLIKQGLSLDSVLVDRDVIYLRSNANVSTGGFAEEVTQQCHSDNILLAERAARLIGLDNAGIDFITTDISISWIESGGKITEINPTPAFGKDISYTSMLNYLFPLKLKGRVPIILFIGNPNELRDYLEIAILRQEKFKSNYAYILDKKLYVCTNRGTFTLPGKKTQDLVTGMLADPVVEAALIQISFAEFEAGLDLQYINLTVIKENNKEFLSTVQHDLIGRCFLRNILTNPFIDEYRKALELLSPS